MAEERGIVAKLIFGANVGGGHTACKVGLCGKELFLRDVLFKLYAATPVEEVGETVLTDDIFNTTIEEDPDVNPEDIGLEDEFFTADDYEDDYSDDEE